jgi:hypothetical protein
MAGFLGIEHPFDDPDDLRRRFPGGFIDNQPAVNRLAFFSTRHFAHLRLDPGCLVIRHPAVPDHETL